jgi:hypothetical protein
MKLKKEPKEIDFLIRSEPWSEKDLADFRTLMNKLKQKSKKTSSKKQISSEKVLVQIKMP